LEAAKGCCVAPSVTAAPGGFVGLFADGTDTKVVRLDAASGQATGLRSVGITGRYAATAIAGNGTGEVGAWVTEGDVVAEGFDANGGPTLKDTLLRWSPGSNARGVAVATDGQDY